MSAPHGDGVPRRPLAGTASKGACALDSYLVAYDICDPKRLRKVARTCEDFGLRRQYSVFFCRLSATDVVRLKSRLYDVIKLDKDQVLFIPLCARCAAQIEALGRPVEAYDAARCGHCELSDELRRRLPGIDE